MNRNLDGTLLSREQLIDLAIEAGYPRKNVTRDKKTYVFHEASRDLRYAMFMRGELLLDTRPDPQPAVEPLTIDLEVVNYLGGRL